MPPKLRVPDEARHEAACRIAKAIDRTMRDLTDACPWPQRGTCPLDMMDAASLIGSAFGVLTTGGACA